jgi:hypothetical protein
LAGTTVTQDAEGGVVSITESPCVATISFSRKNGLPNYSNEEMTIFLQVPLDDTSSLDAIEAQLDPNVAFLKSYVYKQLGVASTIEDGVIVGETPVEAPKSGGKAWQKKPAVSAPTATNGTPKTAPTTEDEKADLWAQLAGATANGKNWKTQGGETIWDNRTDKRNPKSPCFKWADSGKALWLSDAPEWFCGPGEGIKL